MRFVNQKLVVVLLSRSANESTWVTQVKFYLPKKLSGKSSLSCLEQEAITDRLDVNLLRLDFTPVYADWQALATDKLVNDLQPI